MTEKHEGPGVRVTDKRSNVQQDRLDEERMQDEGGGVEDAATQPSEDAPVGADELAVARAEAAGYLEDLQRLKAEFENFRKRMVREQTAMVERASASVIERMLPVLDNFELALLAADRTKDYEAMVRGVELVYGELLDLLHKEGLERIEAMGRAFDPELHEAVMRAEGDDASWVVDEMRPGYKIAGRVVRPAMVKVGPRQEGGAGS